MSASNVKKALQLGMPWGTAAGRLRNLVLFELVRQAGRDRCFKCGETILGAEELSIEHKRAWLDMSPDLFWDLDNVAFSHRACNKAERHPRERRHGIARYQSGCRCVTCKAAKAAAGRREVRRVNPMVGDGTALEKRRA